MQLPFPITLAANAALNKIIKSNPEALQLLSQSRGGVVAFELQNPRLSLRLALLANGVELLSNYDDQPDLQLNADVPALMAMADAGHDPLLDGRVEAEGDLALAGLIQQLMVVLSSDWEAPLANILGDTLAHKIGTAVRGFVAWGAETRNRRDEDVGEYLQEEAKVLVTGSEWQELEQETDQLRERLDRLAARVQQVQP